MGGLSFGAAGAALIAATVTFMGLIISKESKTSDFRQAWIDSLRSEIGDLMVNASAIADALAVKFKSDEERFERLSPLIANLNRAAFLVSLRLNPDEKKSTELLTKLSDLKTYCADTRLRPDVQVMQAKQVNVMISAKAVLKDEWKRVKRGEPFFRVAKWGFLFIAGTISIIFVLSLFGFVSIGSKEQKTISATENAPQGADNLADQAPVTEKRSVEMKRASQP